MSNNPRVKRIDKFFLSRKNAERATLHSTREREYPQNPPLQSNIWGDWTCELRPGNGDNPRDPEHFFWTKIVQIIWRHRSLGIRLKTSASLQLNVEGKLMPMLALIHSVTGMRTQSGQEEMPNNKFYKCRTQDEERPKLRLLPKERKAVLWHVVE